MCKRLALFVRVVARFTHAVKLARSMTSTQLDAPGVLQCRVAGGSGV